MCGNMGGGGSGGSGGTSGGSPLKQGSPETIETRYRKGFMGGYDDEALDAKFDSKTGELSFGYAEDKEWYEGNRQSNKYQHVTITVENGMINGKPVNLDLENSKVKTISAPNNLGNKAQDTFRKNGFDFNSSSQKWEKGYKGYSVKDGILNVDSKLPDNFNGIKAIKTKYGVVDTKPIKQAGFKWDGTQKLWVKK